MSTIRIPWKACIILMAKQRLITRLKGILDTIDLLPLFPERNNKMNRYRNKEINDTICEDVC